MATNRGQQNKNDNWLTPPELVKVLGPFDLDPCCPPVMPWRTARRMLTSGEPTGWKLKGKVFRPVEVDDGLNEEWRGEVLLNNPYSVPLPWMERMAEHRRGVVIASAKSSDTRWAQIMMSSCDVALFLDDRISFCYPDGTQSLGAWSPYVLCGYGPRGVAAVKRAAKVHEYRGVLMRSFT